MPSEQRLHPASLVFAFGRSLKTFALPGLLAALQSRPRLLALATDVRAGSAAGHVAAVADAADHPERGWRRSPAISRSVFATTTPSW